MPSTRDLIFWKAISRAVSVEPCFGFKVNAERRKTAIVGRAEPLARNIPRGKELDQTSRSHLDRVCGHLRRKTRRWFRV